MLAQLDRVTGYEPVGRGFESLTAHQTIRYGSRFCCRIFYADRRMDTPVCFFASAPCPDLRNQILCNPADLVKIQSINIMGLQSVVHCKGIGNGAGCFLCQGKSSLPVEGDPLLSLGKQFLVCLLYTSDAADD